MTVSSYLSQKSCVYIRNAKCGHEVLRHSLYLKEETRREATDSRVLQFMSTCISTIKFHLQAPYVVQILACEQLCCTLDLQGPEIPV